MPSRGRTRPARWGRTSRKCRHTPPVHSPAWQSPPRSDTRQHRPRPRSRLRAARRCDGGRPLGRERRAGQLRPAQGRDGRGRRGPDPLPDARAARDAVRAQRVSLPRPRADLRRARVVPAPHRLVQRVLDALRAGDRRVLRAGGRGRAHAGRQAGVVLVRAGRSRARGDDARASSRRSTRPPTAPTRSWSSRASRASWRGPCCRSGPTPSSTGRSTRGR